MKVALFVPCYVDAFFPEVGIATLELLERLGALRVLDPARLTALATELRTLPAFRPAPVAIAGAPGY